tara:strand:- start:3921 stop:5366 length:1446 start_codon:yes stop_codon:yes gene_type:complete
MSFRIYNTLTRQKEEFIPLTQGKVGMYVCGVTVYDFCHIGHARVAVVFDIIYRDLRRRGFEVFYVRNFTDIDDKIIRRANEEKIPWEKVTEKYIVAFYEDMEKLNCLHPDSEPKATEHIEDMIKLIQKLIEEGKAYKLKGDVYYSVKSFEFYGRLSGKNTDDLLVGARVEVDKRKRGPLDFALWKSGKPGEPSWESPWGKGRPGWHIECSAMSGKILGTHFDIHGGGKDLVFPHHENEIAQSQGANGCPPVKFWIHNGFVNVNKEKMSKSMDNFFTLRDIYQKYSPESLRYFLLTVHYRSPIDFSHKNLEEAEKVLGRFYEFLGETEELKAKHQQPEISECEVPEFSKKFQKAMDDDFNTAMALGHMNDQLRYLNGQLTQLKERFRDNLWKNFSSELTAFREAADALGLLKKHPRDFLARARQIKVEKLNLDVDKIKSLIVDRNSARALKDWAKADAFRKELSSMGILLEDGPRGTSWKVK